jgi:hypothetical protein
MARGTRRLAVPRGERPHAPRTGTTRAPEKGPALADRLGRVAGLRTAVEALELELHRAAVAARLEGATWAQLGDVLDMTPKSAWKRYVGEARPAPVGLRSPAAYLGCRRAS